MFSDPCRSLNLEFTVMHSIVCSTHYNTLCTRSSKLKTGYRYEDKFWNPGFYEWGKVVL